MPLESKQMAKSANEDIGFELDSGYCYLVKEERPQLSYELFERLTANSEGLFITRIYPSKLEEKLKARNLHLIWLSHAPGKDRCHPSSLQSLARVMFNTLERNGTVLLDGLEYLVIHNGFNEMLIFLEQLNEFAMQKKGIVLIPINPVAFDLRELALLERNLKVLEISSAIKTEDFSSLIERY